MVRLLSRRIVRGSTGKLALTFDARRPFQSSCLNFQAINNDFATPLQERDNIRNILRLAQEVRKGIASERVQPSGSSGLSDDSTNTKWWSKSWAEVVQARAGDTGKSVTPASSIGARPLMEISEELQSKLGTPKRMIESNSTFFLPFKSQPHVLEQYISSWGGIRIGRILEDLDSLAGSASYKHVLGRRPTAADHEGNPIFIVTASVDRLDLLESLRADRDYQLNGMVIYVGASSMEVLVTMEDVTDVDAAGMREAGKAVLTGRFTMATRNASTGKAQSIPPIKLLSDAEEQLFAQGQAHKQRKRFEAQTSLEKVPPTSDEAGLVHRIWLAEQNQVSAPRSGQEGFSAVHADDTQLSSVSYMHPQQRNVHMKIFGGYLMRSAYEMAFMTSIVFANGRSVRFLSLDALSFHLPVSIGAILSLTSRIVYTSTSDSVDQSAGHAQNAVASVVVLAELVDSSTGTRQKSNTFHFSFDLGSTDKRVLPESYRDSIAFIEGKRRVDLGNELRRISRSID